MKYIQRKAAKICGRTKGIAEAAESCNVRKETICQWEKIPEFKELMAEEAEKQLSILEAAQDEVDRALVESATLSGIKGAADRKTFYQVLGKLITRLKTEGSLDVEITNLGKLSDEELEAEERRLLGIQAESSGQSKATED